MSHFRKAVQKRDRRCLIENTHRCECQAAHIIPREICKKFSPQFISDPRNGLFLNANMHTLYDQFKWSFDIYDITSLPSPSDASGKQYLMSIIVKSGYDNISIRPYKGQYVAVPIESFPFLYIHYQIFCAHHYETTFNSEDLYRELIEEDRVFAYLLNNPIPVTHLLNHTLGQFLIDQGQLDQPNDSTSMYINTILKRHRNRYLVWWDYLPQSQASWEPSNCLTEVSLQTWRIRQLSKQHSFLPSPPSHKRRRL